MSIPKHLYKYGSFKHPEYLKQIILENKLFFSNPRGFNDPFEFNPHIDGTIPNEQEAKEEFRKTLMKKLPHSSQTKIESHAQIAVDGLKNHPTDLSSLYSKLISQAGVYCLTEDRYSLLMWAHYTDKHTSFCLEFSFDKNSSIGNCLKPVQYAITYPTFKFLTNNFSDAGEKSCLTKSKEWEYEKEWRILAKYHSTPNGENMLEFPPSALTGIILGCRMLYKDKNEIFGWITRRTTPMQIYQAIPDEQEYKLNIIPL